MTLAETKKTWFFFVCMSTVYHISLSHFY